MLTNHLIGAAHNIATHTPRISVAETADPQVVVLSSKATGDAQLTARPVAEKVERDTAVLPNEQRPALELPKRAEMSVAVPDTIPDAQPESIYNAKAIEADQYSGK